MYRRHFERMMLCKDVGRAMPTDSVTPAPIIRRKGRFSHAPHSTDVTTA
jgi:hypothetical protein